MALVFDICVKNVFEERKIVYALELTFEASCTELFFEDTKYDRFSAAGPTYKKNVRREFTRRCFSNIPFPFAGFRRAA
jgi:hypothetical protein